MMSIFVRISKFSSFSFERSLQVILIGDGVNNNNWYTVSIQRRESKIKVKLNNKETRQAGQ